MSTDFAEGLTVVNKYGEKFTITDQKRTDYSAWEGWPTDKVMVVSQKTGKTKWVTQGELQRGDF